MSTCLAMILTMHSGRYNLKMSIHSFIGFSTCVSAYLLQIFYVWIYYRNWILSAKKQMWTSACLAMPTHRGISDLKNFSLHVCLPTVGYTTSKSFHNSRQPSKLTLTWWIICQKKKKKKLFCCQIVLVRKTFETRGWRPRICKIC